MITNKSIQDIHRAITKLLENEKDVSIVWVSSHQGITGNEKADEAAKKATIQGVHSTSHIPINGRELKASTVIAIRNKWNN